MKDKLFPPIVSFLDLNVEINSKKMLYDFIKNDGSITIITDNYEIDTSKLGKQDLAIVIEKNGERHDVSFEMTVVDTIKPVIECDEELTVNIGNDIDLLDGVMVSDNSDERLNVSIKGDYDIDREGEYSLEYYVSDSSGNISTKQFVLKVISLKAAPVSYIEYKKMEDGNYSTDNGYILTIQDGVTYVDGYIIVNKTYALPSSYKTVDPYSGDVMTESCTTCIDKQTMEAFQEMKADARSIGLNIFISSGYRSYFRQQVLYQNYCARDGKIAADTYSARAGHSEHQTGYCFDLNSIDDSFAYTDEGIWVNNNAYLYGFIIRYPKGKEEITGYQYESWHLRYVGKELAEKLYNAGNWITMEEHFGLTSKYN